MMDARSRALTLLCITFGLGLGLARSQVARSDVPIATLVPASTKVLPISRFGYYGNAQCDSSGNLYFHAARTMNDSMVLKIALDGSFSIYTLPAEEAGHTWFLAFRARFDGKLWLLAHGDTDGVFLFEFAHDPTISPTRTRLNTPQHLEVSNFAVLQNDHIILTGAYDGEAPEKQRVRSYFAEFHPSGRLIRSSDEERQSPDVLNHPIVQAMDAPAAQGEDGYTYLLKPDKVLVISPDSTVSREIAVQATEAGFTPFNVYVAGRRMAITFVKKQAKGSAVVRYGLFDTSNGEQLGLYEPSKELGNNLVCFSSEGFVFIRPQGDRVKLVTAAVK